MAKRWTVLAFACLVCVMDTKRLVSSPSEESPNLLKAARTVPNASSFSQVYDVVENINADAFNPTAGFALPKAHGHVRLPTVGSKGTLNGFRPIGNTRLLVRSGLPALAANRDPNSERRNENGNGNTLVSASYQRASLPGEDTSTYLDFPAANLLSQLVIGYPIWTGGWGAGLLANGAHFDNPGSLITGLLGAIPLLALGRAIEYSDAPIFADLNVNTKSFILKTFGAKSQPLFALAICVGIAFLTGVVEETVFRGGILPTIAQWAVDNNFADNVQEGVIFGLVGSSLGFAAGHASLPLSKDTLVLVGLQFVTGLTFGATYLLTQDLAAPIIAHFLYDLYTLYETHLVVTDQVAYAAKNPPPISSLDGKVRRLMGDEFMDAACRGFLLMDTNRDGMISPGEFRMAFYSMGFKPDEAQFQSVFNEVDTDGDGQIQYDEFLQLLLHPEVSYEASEFVERFRILGVRP